MSADHQSIGEVLATLRGDFPDITISKIRFLESQGLIDPERTPSGYRKFRDGDVARLRWILHQQKDNFLPLKVIKARLDDAGPHALPEDLEPLDVATAAAASAPEPEPEPQPAARPASVRVDGGAYNLTELERLVDERGGAHPERAEEWSSYLYFLRDYAAADGSLPQAFDSLVEDTFGALLT
jgi:DNA-binding transcriptional MerR regulator